MFGILRVVLALAVVADHLAAAYYCGPYAVFGFYVLSGYLMTLIMQCSYGYSLHGFLTYAINRWLRIYPIYYIAAAASLLLVALTGDEFSRLFQQSIGYPRSAEEALRNLSLVLRIETETRLVPPAWALTNELCFYLLIGIGLSRTRLLTFVWLGASFAYTWHLVIAGVDWDYRYHPIAASSLPFSVGAALYHLRTGKSASRDLGWLDKPWALWWLIAAILGNYAFGALSAESIMDGYFYVHLVLVALLVLHLSGRKAIGFLTRDQDSRIGDLSYPIYLLHFQVGLALTAATSMPSGNYRFALIASAILIFISDLVVRFVDHPIQALRNGLRNSSAVSTRPQRYAGGNKA